MKRPLWTGFVAFLFRAACGLVLLGLTVMDPEASIAFLLDIPTNLLGWWLDVDMGDNPVKDGMFWALGLSVWFLLGCSIGLLWELARRRSRKPSAPAIKT